MATYWLEFVICTAVVVYSGANLSRYGDVLAEKLGLGRVWIGAVMLASATSLPELATGISSVTIADAPDIAVGDIFGSCVFNMLLLAMLDALHRPAPISSVAEHSNIFTAAFGIVMISMAGVVLHADAASPALGWIGLLSVEIVIVYMISIRLIFEFEKRRRRTAKEGEAPSLMYGKLSKKDAIVGYAVNSVIVVIAASFLPTIGKGISEQMGISQGFVGNVFIAATTSLPELVVSISALRLGAVDLAIGNLFGSNVFNIFILAIDDFLYLKGPLLQHVSDAHIIPAFTACAMTAVAILGLMYRRQHKTFFIAWDSMGIVLLYISNLMYLYAVR
jgi:cation:H+ antiporter